MGAVDDDHASCSLAAHCHSAHVNECFGFVIEYVQSAAQLVGGGGPGVGTCNGEQKFKRYVQYTFRCGNLFSVS